MRTDTWDLFAKTSAFAAATGLFADLAQSPGAWSIRGLTCVKQAFGFIWGTMERPEEDLLVSMDVVLLWRPWWINSTWLPETEGFHLDENPFKPPRTKGPHPNLDCVQGMVPLLPVTQETGGLQVVPFSHEGEKKIALRARYPQWQKQKGDWCVLPRSDPIQDEGGLLLLAGPGDLILWDSRTVHGGRVGVAPAGSVPHCAEAVELARMSVAVAMTPRALANSEVEKMRREGFLCGKPFTHRPHGVTHSGQCPGKFPVESLPTLNAAQRKLLGDVPISPKEVLKHYAAAFRSDWEGAAGQRSLAVADWAAGAWTGAGAVEEVFLGVIDIFQQHMPAAAVRLLAELVEGGLLEAAEVIEGFDRLKKLEPGQLEDMRLDFPLIDEYLTCIMEEVEAWQRSRQSSARPTDHRCTGNEA